MRSFELWVLGYLLNSLWQIPLVFGAAWVAARLGRSAGPRAVHRVWVSALVVEAVLPACPLMDLGGVWGRLKSLVMFGLAGGGVGRVHASIGGGVAGGSGLVRFPTAVVTGVLVLYVGVVLYFVGRLGWGLWKTMLMRRQATPLTLAGEARRTWERCLALFGLSGRGDGPEIRTSRMIRGPVTVGVRRQVLLVPPRFMERVEQGDLDALLAHEIVHMRRRDFAKNLLYEVLSLAGAYHPLLRLTRRRLAESREMVCDAMAADAVAGRARYARSLLRLASILSDRPPARVLHAIGIFDANIFERRVMNLTERRVEVRGMRRAAIAVACVAMGVATCVSAVALRVEVSAPAGQDKTPTTLSVDASKMQNMIIYRKSPVYPVDAKANKDTLDGSVVLGVVLGTDGVPVKVFVKKSLRADYDQSAMDAVREWRWKPFLLNGEPIQVTTTVTVNYTLAD